MRIKVIKSKTNKHKKKKTQNKTKSSCTKRICSRLSGSVSSKKGRGWKRAWQLPQNPAQAGTQEHWKQTLHGPHLQSRKGKVSTCAMVWEWMWFDCKGRNCTVCSHHSSLSRMKSTSLSVPSSDAARWEIQGLLCIQMATEPGEQPDYKGSK